MKIDSKLARILSDFFLDLAKAAFVGTFITNAFSPGQTLGAIIFTLTRALVSVILFLLISWQLARLETEI